MDEGREGRYGRGTRTCGRFIRSRDREHGSRRDEERETRREREEVRAIWYALWSGRSVRRLLRRRCATGTGEPPLERASHGVRAAGDHTSVSQAINHRISPVWYSPVQSSPVQYRVERRRRRCWGRCLGPSRWQSGLKGGERRDRSGTSYVVDTTAIIHPG